MLGLLPAGLHMRSVTLQTVVLGPAWLCVLGCWCTSIRSFGWLNSVGVFQE